MHIFYFIFVYFIQFPVFDFGLDPTYGHLLSASLTAGLRHGYCRWSEICADTRFALLNKPFSPDVKHPESEWLLVASRF